MTTAAPKFPQRLIGDTPVSAIGLGCLTMAITQAQDPSSEAASFEVLTAAADMGINFWVTSSSYANSESMLGRWFAATGRRKEIFLCTKFGGLVQSAGNTIRLSSKPEDVKAACEKSLKALQTDYIDLFAQHRVDPDTPIEHTIQALVELKQEGKIRQIGLSECSARSLRRAHKVHPIATAEMEYSPFAMEIESSQTDFLKTAKELGVKIVAYAPLGKGFFSGTIKSQADLDEKDWRRNSPRFLPENFEGNLRLVEEVELIARQKGCKPSQLLIAWVLFQGEDFIPLPGTKQVKWLKENAESVNIKITNEDDQKIRNAINKIGGTKGSRYPEHMMKYCFGDSPELGQEL